MPNVGGAVFAVNGSSLGAVLDVALGVQHALRLSSWCAETVLCVLCCMVENTCVLGRVGLHMQLMGCSRGGVRYSTRCSPAGHVHTTMPRKLLLDYSWLRSRLVERNLLVVTGAWYVTPHSPGYGLESNISDLETIGMHVCAGSETPIHAAPNLPRP